MHYNISDSVFESHAFDSVVVSQRLGLFGAIKSPEGREAALLEQVMESRENRKERGQRVWLIRVCARSPLIEQ